MTTPTLAPHEALRAYAEGRINHLNAGLCPDVLTGPESRDPDCPVCNALRAQAAERAVPATEAWLPMETAPKDGTLVRLLVEFENHATEDGEGPQPTIGSNTADNTGEDIGWQFAGWCWTHDCYTQGEGKPVGWLPMLAAAPAQPAARPDEPAKTDPRKLRLQSIVFALARLSCVPPVAPALEHQLERLIEFHFEDGDEEFARKLVQLKRGTFSNGRRSVLVPSAAQPEPAPAQQVSNMTDPAGEGPGYDDSWKKEYTRACHAADRAARAPGGS